MPRYHYDTVQLNGQKTWFRKLMFQQSHQNNNIFEIVHSVNVTEKKNQLSKSNNAEANIVGSFTKSKVVFFVFIAKEFEIFIVEFQTEKSLILFLCERSGF